MFFPPIFVYITGHIRAKLYDFAISNNLERDVAGFATDSITLTKELDLHETKDLGKFSFQKSTSDFENADVDFMKILILVKNMI